MPQSRTRTKKPSALRGVPAVLLAKAPGNLSPADKAAWVGHYLDGASDRPYRRPRGATMGDWSARAHQRGRAEGHSDVEGVRGDIQTSKRRRDRRVGLDVDVRLARLENRLEAITGISPEMRALGEDLAARIMPGLGYGLGR